jgi:hypothetical protein
MQCNVSVVMNEVCCKKLCMKIYCFESVCPMYTHMHFLTRKVSSCKPTLKTVVLNLLTASTAGDVLQAVCRLMLYHTLLRHFLVHSVANQVVQLLINNVFYDFGAANNNLAKIHFSKIYNCDMFQISDDDPKSYFLCFEVKFNLFNNSCKSLKIVKIAHCN